MSIINFYQKIPTILIKRTLKIISNSYKKEIYPSASRNSAPILDVLLKVLDTETPNLKLLEISSGTGQHSGYFAEHFPNITFQPSEYEKSLLGSIQAYANDATHRNVKTPVFIDITTNCENWNYDFAKEKFDYMLNVNMIHISPWECTEGLFRNASKLLKSQGLLVTYGPYAVDGVLTPESNRRFDAGLKLQNPQWGVRDIRDLKELALQYQIRFRESYDMPANNKTLIWVKD